MKEFKESSGNNYAEMEIGKFGAVLSTCYERKIFSSQPVNPELAKLTIKALQRYLDHVEGNNDDYVMVSHKEIEELWFQTEGSMKRTKLKIDDILNTDILGGESEQ